MSLYPSQAHSGLENNSSVTFQKVQSSNLFRNTLSQKLQNHEPTTTHHTTTSNITPEVFFSLTILAVISNARILYVYPIRCVWSNNATTKISAQPSREMHSGRLLWSRRSSTKASSQRRRRVMRISLFWAKRDG